MNKIITVIVCASIFSHHIMCMKRPISQQPTRIQPHRGAKRYRIINPLVDPVLPIDIIGYMFINSFKTDDGTLSAVKIQDKIRTICLVNKALRAYICSPSSTRIILNNSTSALPVLKDLSATFIGTPAMKNYLNKSRTLNEKIESLSLPEITDLILEGADVNYYSSTRRPLLLKTLNDCEKTGLLLEWGANPCLEKNKIKSNCSCTIFTSAYDVAFEEKNIEILKLFIKYYPITLSSQDRAVMELLLKEHL